MFILPIGINYYYCSTSLVDMLVQQLLNAYFFSRHQTGIAYTAGSKEKQQKRQQQQQQTQQQRQSQQQQLRTAT